MAGQKVRMRVLTQEAPRGRLLEHGARLWAQAEAGFVTKRGVMSMACIPTMTEIRGAIHDAVEQTDRVEQRALAILYQQGCMLDLTCDQQREVESIIRYEIERVD